MAKPTIDEQNNDDFGVVNIERMQCFMPKDLEALLTEARIDAEKKLAEEHLKNCLKTDTCEVLESARKTANRVYNEGLAQLKNKGGDSE